MALTASVKGGLEGLRLAYVGDGNNVATSLIEGAVLLGVRISVASPPGYEPPADVIDSPRSVVFRQAENRLHTEKALLMALLASGDDA